MSTNRSGRIDRDAAEHLLTGATDDPQGGRGALTVLLAAASAPGTARELAGEAAALTAFRRRAQLTAPVPQSRRRRAMASCTPSRSLTAKVAAAALAATALGGVAVAAGTGNLPVSLGGAKDDGPSAAPTGAPSSSRGPGLAGQLPGASASTTALLKLCQDWQSAGLAPTDSRFEPLTRAAGGPDRVGTYCRTAAAHPGTAVPQSASATPDQGKTGPDPTASHGKSDATSHPGKPTPDPTSTPTPDPSPTDTTGAKGGHGHTPAPPGATASSHAKQ